MLRRLTLCLVGLVAGLASWKIADDSVTFSFATRSWVGMVALLGAGWSVVGATVITSMRPARATLSLLLGVAAIAWFLGEWDNPGTASSTVFTVGLVLAPMCPPLVMWLMFGYPSGRLASVADRLAVGAGLASALALGVLPTLYFDPAAAGCGPCATNLIAITDDPQRSSDLGSATLWIAAAATVAAIALAAWRLWRASPARRRLVGPVVLAAAAFLAVVVWSHLANADTGFQASGDEERRRWLAEAAALAAVGAAVVWNEWRGRRMRSSVARATVQFGGRADGSLRDVLARALGDPHVELAYPLHDGTHVDATGGPVVPTTNAEHTMTPLVTAGGAAATLVHRRGALDDPVLVDEIVAAAGLAIENERLQAELLYRERELRASRRRAVEAGDTERRRLERNLHDGCQQRLIGLLLTARYAHTLVAPSGDPPAVARVDALIDELTTAIDELRETAHGIHPAVLTDEGLAAAIETLADELDMLTTDELPEERYPAAVESAAYRVITAVAHSGPTHVSACRRGGTLVLDLTAGDAPADLVDIEDRVGAADGHVTTTRLAEGTVSLRVELPCG